jgi:membrane-associated protease RseP (regulator of RpoE activity)
VGLPSPPGVPAPGLPADAPDELLPFRLEHRFVFPPRPPTAWQRWGRNLALFLLTVASVFLVGGLRTVVLPGSGPVLAIDVADGLRLVVGLLGILVAHEMGHYLAARYYGVDATLPFFIPFPLPGFSLVGTLGAFIRIRGPIPNRRALFDIGVAGPLAGFAVCLPVLWLGIREATVQVLPPDAGGIFFGEPLAFRWMARLVHGAIRDDQTLVMGQWGMAAWFGLFVTALNLMPIGQLDGGHLTYALLRERSRLVSRIGSWLCVALVYFGPNWILWAVLVRVLGRRHPPTLDDEAPVGRGRAWIGLLALGVFVLCFVPDPIVFSWRDFFEAVGLPRLLP